MARKSSVEDGWQELNVQACSRCNLKTSDSALFQAHHCKPKAQPITAGVSYSIESAKFTCSLCRVELPEDEFSEHLECHVSAKPYICSYCGNDYDARAGVTEHVKSCHGNCDSAFLLMLSVKTQEIMQRAKNLGKEFYQPITGSHKALPDLFGRLIPNSNSIHPPTRSSISQKSVAESATSQKKVKAPPNPACTIVPIINQKQVCSPSAPACTTVRTTMQKNLNALSAPACTTVRTTMQKNLNALSAPACTTVRTTMQKNLNALSAPVCTTVLTTMQKNLNASSAPACTTMSTVIQPVPLGIQSHVVNQQNPSSRICLARQQFLGEKSRVFFLGYPVTISQSGSLPTSAAHILQTQATPCISQGVSVPAKELSWRLAVTQRLPGPTNVPLLSNNLPMVVKKMPAYGTGIRMTSNPSISCVNQVHHSPTLDTEGHLTNSTLVSSRGSASCQNVIEDLRNDTDTVNLVLPVSKGVSNNVCDNVCIDSSHNLTLQGHQEVSNSVTHPGQGIEMDATLKREDSTDVDSDWSMQIRVENIESLSGCQEDILENVQNISSISSNNAEPLTDPLTETSHEVKTVEPTDFSYLPVAKGHLFCLTCKIKWRQFEYDKFFRHIWEKHAHGTDFSCCPAGYSVNCPRLKTALNSICERSQASECDAIRSYMSQPTTDCQTLNESTPSQEHCAYSSASKQSSSVSLSSSGENQQQSTATSESARSVPCGSTQIVPAESVTHSGESGHLSNIACNPEQLTNKAPSFRLENEKDSSTGTLTSGKLREKGLQESMVHAMRRPSPREDIVPMAGAEETQRHLREHLQTNTTISILNNTATSMSSDHCESSVTANVYEDISGDEGDGCSSKSTKKANSCLEYPYSEELPLDLSKKAPRPGKSNGDPSVPSVSAGETPVASSVPRMGRMSTESLGATDHDDDDNSLKFFYECGFHNCLFTSPGSADFKVHNQEIHCTESEFPCVYCGFRSISSKILIHHMKEHIGSDKTKTFSCSLLENSDKVAQFENNDIEFIIRMLKTSLAANSESDAVFHFACNICMSKFVNLEELRDHLENSLLKIVECKHCESYFLNSFSWQKHMATKHANLPRTYCIKIKLLCYDKINKRVPAQILQEGSHLPQHSHAEVESEITVNEKQHGGRNLETLVASVTSLNVIDEAGTDTSRIHGSKSDAGKVCNQDIHLPETQSDCEERSHILVSCGTQNQNKQHQQILESEKSLTLVLPLPAHAENVSSPAVPSIYTAQSFVGTDSVHNVQPINRVCGIIDSVNHIPRVQPTSPAHVFNSLPNASVKSALNNVNLHIEETSADISERRISTSSDNAQVKSGRNNDPLHSVTNVSNVESGSQTNAINDKRTNVDSAQPVSQLYTVGERNIVDRLQAVSDMHVVSRGRDSADHVQPFKQKHTFTSVLSNENQDSVVESGMLATRSSGQAQVQSENGNSLPTVTNASCMDTSANENSKSYVIGDVDVIPRIQKSQDQNEKAVCSSKRDSVAVKNKISDSDLHLHPIQITPSSSKKIYNLASSANNHAANGLFMDKESSTLRERNEYGNRGNALSQSVTDTLNAQNLATNSLEFTKTKKSLVVSVPDKNNMGHGAEANSVQQCMGVSKFHETRKDGHSSSALKALDASHLTFGICKSSVGHLGHENLDSVIDTQSPFNSDSVMDTEDQINLDSVKHAEGQFVSLMTDGSSIMSQKDLSSCSTKPAAENEEPGQINALSSNNIRFTNEVLTQVTENESSVVSGESELEDARCDLPLPVLMAPCLDCQPENGLMPAKHISASFQQSENNAIKLDQVSHSKDSLQIIMDDLSDSSAIHHKSDHTVTMKDAEHQILGKSVGSITFPVPVTNNLCEDQNSINQASVGHISVVRTCKNSETVVTSQDSDGDSEEELGADTTANMDFENNFYSRQQDFSEPRSEELRESQTVETDITSNEDVLTESSVVLNTKEPELCSDERDQYETSNDNTVREERHAEGVCNPSSLRDSREELNLHSSSGREENNGIAHSSESKTHKSAQEAGTSSNKLLLKTVARETSHAAKSIVTKDAAPCMGSETAGLLTSTEHQGVPFTADKHVRVEKRKVSSTFSESSVRISRCGTANNQSEATPVMSPSEGIRESQKHVKDNSNILCVTLPVSSRSVEQPVKSKINIALLPGKYTATHSRSPGIDEKKVTPGPIQSVEDKTSSEREPRDKHREAVMTYKFARVNREAQISCNSSFAIKRKLEDGQEGKFRKQQRSDDTMKSSTQMQNTDMTIPHSAPHFKCSVCTSLTSHSYTELKLHVKSQHPNDRSAKVCRMFPVSSLPDYSGVSKKRKGDIYRCIHSNCHFTCEWNTNSMNDHINSKHPYYSCGYCDAPYSLQPFLKNHFRFVHRGMKPLIKCGTISLDLLFKNIEESIIPPNENKQSKVKGIRLPSHITESSSKGKLKKSENKTDSNLKTTETEKHIFSRDFDVQITVTNNQQDEPAVDSKRPNGVNEKASKQHGEIQSSVSQTKKSHVVEIPQAKPESILEQMLMEVSPLPGGQENPAEKWNITSKTTAVSSNVDFVSEKTKRNVFERTAFISNSQLGLGVSVGSKLVNTVSEGNSKKEKSPSEKSLTNTLAKTLSNSLKLPLAEIMLSKKNVLHGPDSSFHSQLKMKKHEGKDMSEHKKSSQLSAIPKGKVSVENWFLQGASLTDAVKPSIGPSASCDTHHKKQSIDFSSLSKNDSKYISGLEKPSGKIKTQDLCIANISKITNASAGVHGDHEKSKEILHSETPAQYFSGNMLSDYMKTTTPKVMTPRSSLRDQSDRNCGIWTESHVETKVAAEGSQIREPEPEIMRVPLLNDGLTVQNESKVYKQSELIYGKNLAVTDIALTKTPNKWKKTDYPFRCTLCRRIVKCLYDIEKHFKEHHPTDYVRLTERISGFIYSSSGQCLGGKDDRKAPTHSQFCRYCAYSSVKRSEVEAHIRKVHPQRDVKVFSLSKPSTFGPMTNTELTSKLTTPQHAASRSNSPAPTQYCCSVCSDIQSSEFMFRLHLARHPCFKHTTLLTTGASFVCHTCGYIAKSNNDLAQHTGEHMSERRFKCFMCEHDSHHKQGVRAHIRNVHNMNVDDDTGVIDRQKQRNPHLKPRLVGIDPRVSLVNPFRQPPDYLQQLLLKHGIKMLDLPGDCPDIQDKKYDDYFEVNKVM